MIWLRSTLVTSVAEYFLILLRKPWITVTKASSACSSDNSLLKTTGDVQSDLYVTNASSSSSYVTCPPLSFHWAWLTIVVSRSRQMWLNSGTDIRKFSDNDDTNNANCDWSNATWMFNKGNTVTTTIIIVTPCNINCDSAQLEWDDGRRSQY